jgi:hypothetical protein
VLSVIRFTDSDYPFGIFKLFYFLCVIMMVLRGRLVHKGNNKITEPRTILQRESQNSQVYKQTKSVNNRKTVKTVMTLTWYRHFLRNGGLNQILKRQTSPFYYGSKFPAVTITVFITILEQNRQNSCQKQHQTQ